MDSLRMDIFISSWIDFICLFVKYFEFCGGQLDSNAFQYAVPFNGVLTFKSLVQFSNHHLLELNLSNNCSFCFISIDICLVSGDIVFIGDYKSV